MLPKFLRSRFLLCALFAFLSVGFWQSRSAVAETFYVSVTGDDENPGTRAQPWRSVSESALRLTAGDRLLIFPGSYLNEGEILVRKVEPETFEYFPLEGSKSETTYIGSATWVRPRIYGSIDIRGSHINVENLTVLGDRETPNAGISAFESHNIAIKNCIVAYHGGGGIQFVLSDLVTAVNNRSYFNAATNPDQHSGISSFQPVVRTDTGEQYGVVFAQNICFGNRTEVPNSQGSITDGNGIILDDHNYTQFNGQLADVIAGTSDPQSSSGDPELDLDAEGNPLPYRRRSVVSGNVCVKNGGRGIHVFLSDNAVLWRNLCITNLRSQGVQDTLPRDETGNPFFLFGEINVADSTRIDVLGNTAAANQAETAAAAEHLFDLQGQATTNRWQSNRFFNFFPNGPIVSVANAPDSELLLLDK